jgi:hypothetical protein
MVCGFRRLTLVYEVDTGFFSFFFHPPSSSILLFFNSLSMIFFSRFENNMGCFGFFFFRFVFVEFSFSKGILF